MEIKNDNLVTISIIIAGIIISGSILYSRDLSFDWNKNATEDEKEEITGISPVRENEPMLGDPEADILFIEYSDTECPFSSQFAKEREKIMSSFGSEGRVAWVYRAIPGGDRASIIKALSLECVSEDTENHKFWRYLRRVENKELSINEDGEPDIEILVTSAEKENIDPEKIRECIQNETYLEKVKRNLKEAVSEEATGTPFTVILLPEDLSSIKQQKINTDLKDIPANIITIPAKPDRIFLNGLLTADKIEKILDIILSED